MDISDIFLGFIICAVTVSALIFTYTIAVDSERQKLKTSLEDGAEIGKIKYMDVTYTIQKENK